MTHPPAFEICVARQDAWRAGVGLLAALCAATSVLWWIAHAPPRPTWVGSVALAGCALAMACAASLLRTQPAPVLRWDGQRWWLAGGSAPAEAGLLNVAVDLGAWMLLRFTPEGRLAWQPPRWIPAQRRGLEGAWHALRCGVHASRPGREAASA